MSSFQLTSGKGLLCCWRLKERGMWERCFSALIAALKSYVEFFQVQHLILSVFTFLTHVIRSLTTPIVRTSSAFVRVRTEDPSSHPASIPKSSSLTSSNPMTPRPGSKVEVCKSTLTTFERWQCSAVTSCQEVSIIGVSLTSRSYISITSRFNCQRAKQAIVKRLLRGIASTSFFLLRYFGHCFDWWY